MVFSSTIFLFAFLPVVIICYYGQQWVSPGKLRNVLLLFFSYLFYLYGAAGFVLILFLSTAADYLLGLLIARDSRHKRLWVGLSLLLNLGLLVYSKYADFFVGEFSVLLVEFGLSPIKWGKVILPLGISFFTFHKLSYVIDVYRGRSRCLENFIDFALYVALFPKLIAGPLVRYGHLEDQLKDRTESWDFFYRGAMRFCWGLAKKVMIANACGEIANLIFGLHIETLDTKTAWLGSIAYTLQIYFDFSAYTDMAIGLGMLFGFELPENFKRPYSAVSITDFWRRWHITLSRWFRDYLYIPLGGNRQGTARTYLNLGVVFVLCGLWHGANWTYLLWGLYHGVFLMLERATGVRDLPPEKHSVVRRLTTLLVVTVGWVVFRSDDISHATRFLEVMFTVSNVPLSYELSRVLDYQNILFLMTAVSVFFMPGEFSGIESLINRKNRIPSLAGAIVIMLLFLYSATLVVGGSNGPFIYYRF